ncbi:MAG: hypothetical protein AAF266_00505 [Planctomycetota bacterium]
MIDAASPPKRRLFACALLMALALVQVSGCSCRSETPEERAARLAKEEAERIALEEKKREEARLRAPVQLPPAQMLPAGDGPLSVFVKPGHWNAIVQPAKANAEDFDGTITYEVVRSAKRAGPTFGSTDRLVSRRPLVVAAQSEKAVDSLFYCPPTDKEAPKLRSVVADRRTGVELQDFTTPLRPLLGHQYHFVVLAKEPNRYAFLDSLYSVTARLESRIDTSAVDGGPNRLPVAKNYRVVAVPIETESGEIALPDNPLAWTSIAYVLWDEVDPAALRPAQRDALVDWINWGGQLIVNGPDSLDLLRGSFLAPLLPATSDGARKIEPRELQAFAARWSVGKNGRELPTDKPWSGIELDPADGSRSLPGMTELLVERRVGRGRIVVSAMQLADARLLNWSRGVQNFYNAAVLRRPPRRFVPGDEYGDPEEGLAATQWADRKEPLRFDPLLNTASRYFVRDSLANPDSQLVQIVNEGVGSTGVNYDNGPEGQDFGDGFLTLKPPTDAKGVGAVDDFNLATNAVRDVLRESAGVSVPDAGFVIGCLAAYLLVLVPLNWGFFSAIGRVELAWAAAPVIALAGGWVVIQQARLDIGFVRSRTEVAVLELQPDTPRGLLTRFTALYTSLSTTYEMEFDAAAVASPFPSTARRGDGPIAVPKTIAYERQEKARLKDLLVSSATTEFFRSEEMLDVSAVGVPGSSVAGSIRIDRGPDGAPRLENRTAWTLEDVMVIGRPDGLRGEPQLEGCWLGELKPGDNATVAYLPIPAATSPSELPFDRERSEAARLRAVGARDRLELRELIKLAADPSRFEPGERRVVCLVSELMPGVTIEPASSQRQGTTVIVGHLEYGPLPPPKSDVNAPLDVQ